MNVREWALPVYTILMQLAVGALFVLWSIRTLARLKMNSNEIDRIMQNPIFIISFTILIAIIGAHFHLSRPFHSFLAALNFRSSWLSREIVFTFFFFLTTFSLWLLIRQENGNQKLLTSMGWVSILFGGIVVYCMARIYLLPTQVAWDSSLVIISFFTTTLLLGGGAIMCLMVLDLKFAELQKSDDVNLRVQVFKYSFAGLALFTFVLVIVNIVVTFAQINILQLGDITARTSLSLLFDFYLPLFIIRMMLLPSSCLVLGYTAYRMYKLGHTPQNLLSPVYLSCLLILIGEIVGRFLFYATHIRVGI
jgi:anaerobic dimethyl sulfoxide reductase subunit C (anchor subunit)